MSLRQLSRVLCRNLQTHQRLQVRHIGRDTDMDAQYVKTALEMLSMSNETNLYIDSFAPHGFTFNNGFRVIGPIAVFPCSFLHWNVTNASSITVDALSLFCMLEPKLDILVIGYGDYEHRNLVDSKIVPYLKAKQINVELLPTEQACSTFNFLNDERRYVAGALLPPTFVQDDTSTFSLEPLERINLLGQSKQFDEMEEIERKSFEKIKERAMYAGIEKNTDRGVKPK